MLKEIYDDLIFDIKKISKKIRYSYDKFIYLTLFIIRNMWYSIFSYRYDERHRYYNIDYIALSYMSERCREKYIEFILKTRKRRHEKDFKNL